MQREPALLCPEAVGLSKPGGSLLLLATYWDGFEIPAFDLCLQENSHHSREHVRPR